MSQNNHRNMLVIFAELDLTTHDRLRIEKYRKRNDPQHGIVAAHFTLVFPFAETSTKDALAHTNMVAATTQKIEFRLTEAKAVRDPLVARSHIFLLPREGRKHIQALHDRLYTGPLAQHLSQDIPYEPHVTVGSFGSHKEAEAAMVELTKFDIPGGISAINLAKYNGRELINLNKIVLN